MECTGLKPCDFKENPRDTVLDTEKILQDKSYVKSITYDVADPSHNLKVVGSNPTPATNLNT
jgi:hypothetical protein